MMNLQMLSLLKKLEMSADQMSGFNTGLALPVLAPHIAAAIEEIATKSELVNGVAGFIKLAIAYGVSLAPADSQKRIRVAYNLQDLFEDGVRLLEYDPATASKDNCFMGLVNAGGFCMKLLPTAAVNAVEDFAFESWRLTWVVGPCIALGFISASITL